MAVNSETTYIAMYN